MTIRQDHGGIRAELASRAARPSLALQEYLAPERTGFARQPRPADLWDRVQHRVRATGTRLPAAEILDLRDHDRT